MENIRLPEDFTDQVMRKIEVRERARTRRTRAIAVAGGILGGTLLSAAVALLISHYGMALTLPAGAARSHDIAGFITGFFSNISAALHGALAIPAVPLSVPVSPYCSSPWPVSGMTAVTAGTTSAPPQNSAKKPEMPSQK